MLDFTKQNSDAGTVQYTCKRMLHDKVMPVIRAQAKTAAMMQSTAEGQGLMTGVCM